MLRMRTPPAGRSALRPRLRGRICSPRMGLKSRETSRGLSPWQAMMSLTATVPSKASIQVTLMGRLFAMIASLGRIRSRRIATGTVTFRDGATIQGDIFIAPDGSKFAFVRTDPEFVGASIDEQVTAKRVGE